MPEKEQVLKVNIKTKKPENPKECLVTPDFVAKPGSTIVFEFPEFAQTAEIVFLGQSPLETRPPVRPGSHKVRNDAPTGPIKYVVTWPEASGGPGNGNGSGEVIPG